MVLYSENMQDGLVVENRIRIVNPFKEFPDNRLLGGRQRLTLASRLTAARARLSEDAKRCVGRMRRQHEPAKDPREYVCSVDANQ